MIGREEDDAADRRIPLLPPGQQQHQQQRMSEASQHSRDVEDGIVQEIRKKSDVGEDGFGVAAAEKDPPPMMIGANEESDFFGHESLSEEIRHYCQKLLRNVFYIAMPLSIVASIYACLYGWIFVNTTQYMTEMDSWQRCIIYNSPSTPTTPVTPQNFAVSASAFGGLMFIFMGLGFKAGYLALHDIELLPYSLAITSYTLLAQLVYRPVNPVVPAITELTPTLISLTYFINNDMYKDVPGATDGACHTAYKVNLAFLSFQYFVFAANVFNLFIQIYAAWRTRKIPREEPYVLVGYKPSIILVTLAYAAYVMTTTAKEDAALKTMFLLEKVGKSFLFPFQKATMDVVGLFLLLTIASVIFGVCKQQIEAFKWASFTAYVHVLLSYPIIINNFQAFHLYGFWNDAGCKSFLETDTTHSGGNNRRLLFWIASMNYPEIELQFCRDTRLALVGQVIQFLLMHLTCAACLYVVLRNWAMERPSMQIHLFGSGGGESGGKLPSRLSSSSSSSLQEPFILPTGDHSHELPANMRRSIDGHAIMDSSQGGGAGAGRNSFGSIRSRARTSTTNSLNDHLLGPVLD